MIDVHAAVVAYMLGHGPIGALALLRAVSGVEAWTTADFAFGLLMGALAVMLGRIDADAYCSLTVWLEHTSLVYMLDADLTRSEIL